MASITAVELGADSCVLARASVRSGAIHVSAVETLDPAAFPGVDAFTAALTQARRTLKFPRRCRAVVWGLPDGAGPKDIAVQSLLAPLTGAGFRVARVVSPCNALAALARVKSVRGDGATCWLTINRGGVAIVVVRPGKQLYSYSFPWDSSIGSSGSQARLLQRYSLVAILGPEVKRAMAEARKHGIAVDAVVTCGNLPDLRSLTMPLIEELDVEVETLDSLEGLVVKPAAAERLAELAPAIRLACAGLIARGTRPWDEQRRESVRRTGAALRFAAAAALVLGIGYVWYMRAELPVVSAMWSRPTDNRPVSAAKPPWKPPARAASDAAKKPESNPAAAKSNPPAVSEAAKRAESNPKQPASNPASANAPTSLPPAVRTTSSAPAPSVPAPAVSDAAKRAESNPPAVSVPAKRAESNPAAVRAKEVTPRRGAPVAEAKPPVPPPPVAAKPSPRVVNAGSTPPAPSVPAKPAESRGAPSVPAPAGSDAAKRAESNPPAVSDAAKRAESNPKSPESRGAVSVPAKRPESNPPAVSVPAKKPESNPKSTPSVSAAAARANEIAPRRGAPVAGGKPPALLSTPPSVPAPAVSDAAKKAESNPPAVSEPAKRPESNPPAVSDTPKRAEPNAKIPESSTTRTDPPRPGPLPQAPRTEVSPPATPGGLNTSASPADKTEAARNRPLPALLKDPLPRVTTILVSSDRRFATIEGGLIIGIGDVLGRRIVVAIDERTVVLREPSGVQIRVGLGGRVVAVGRSDR